MFRTEKESKRTAPFRKGDKVVLKINTEGLSEARIAEAKELFSEVYEVMYFSFTHHNWICQDEAGNQCQFDTNKIEHYSGDQETREV